MKIILRPILPLLLFVFIFSACAQMAWDRASKENSITGYKTYLSKYPNKDSSPIARERIESLNWEQALKNNYVKGYETYLMNYPNGLYKDEATARIEKLVWDEAIRKDTPSGYKSYIDIYPNGKYLNEAKSKKEDIAWSKASNKNEILSYEEYINNYPNGKFAEDAKKKIEDLLWTQKNAEGTISAYQEYIDRYPNGKYMDQAKRAYEEAKKKDLNNNLLQAFLKNDFDVFKRLVTEGADINSTTDDGYSPLMIASLLGDERQIKFLIALGANCNISLEDGSTPLHFAALRGCLNCVKILLNQGVDINAIGMYKSSPLDLSKGQVAKYLQQHGAKKQIRNDLYRFSVIFEILRNFGRETDTTFRKSSFDGKKIKLKRDDITISFDLKTGPFKCVVWRAGPSRAPAGVYEEMTPQSAIPILETQTSFSAKYLEFGDLVVGPKTMQPKKAILTALHYYLIWVDDTGENFTLRLSWDQMIGGIFTPANFSEEALFDSCLVALGYEDTMSLKNKLKSLQSDYGLKSSGVMDEATQDLLGIYIKNFPI
jgi:hypothetical protein